MINGAFQPYDRGHDSTTNYRSQDPGGHNAYLTFGGKSKKLWVNDMQIGFALAGSAANSYRTRSFFARNFSQVNFVVSCQFPDQQRYAEFAEFVRHAQVGFNASSRLDILNRYQGPDTHNNQRGPGSRISAEGYVQSVPRQHERFIQAPTMVFQFTVSKMIQPTTWADSQDQKVRYFKSWKEIVSGGSFLVDSDQSVVDLPEEDQ